MRPEGKAMDSMSEVSEGTTGTSVSGRGTCYSEELQDFALQLGMTGADQLFQERFRVDRRKLEVMLRVADELTEPADEFFQRVMHETCTHISWPSRLKIGAKSKKDPHIRISGREDDVLAAKSKVMAVLDTRQSNRVTMKLDVSYTDHSHIIGRGGLSIKSVMQDTGCHIHFPDSNRNNPHEKSNQVSIAGEMEGVEKARARVRELTPLIFSFELPILGTLNTLPDASSPYISCIQEKYNVQVLFRTRPKLHSTLVLVKGCEWELAKVKEATHLLVKHMCDNLAGQVSILMMMEISPQHHSIVVGKNHENLKQIIRRTGVNIVFPDATDPNIPPLKRSSVTISGNIHSVYLARQQLIGMLPLLLIFDVPENYLTTNMNDINEIMHSHEVIIQIRNKPKQNVVSVTIKGLEKNANNIYEARRQLIGLKEPAVVANIPSTYVGVNQIAVNTCNNHTCNVEMLSPNCLSVNNMFLSPHSQSPVPELSGWNQLTVPYNQLVPQQHLLLQHLLPRGQQQHNTLGHSLSMPDIAGGYSSLSSNTSPLSSPCASPRNASPVQNMSADQRSDNNNVFTTDLNELKAPGFERHKKFFDYHNLKMQANQATQAQPKSTDLRVPNSTWSGLGLSQSSPSAVLKEQKQREALALKGGDIWSSDHNPGSSPDLTGLSASNYLETLPSGLLESISTTSQQSDLYSMLASMGLDKYTQLFKSHEVDLATFQTLSEVDLKEIGVSAFGARRKMLLCISELNKRPFRCSAAVGAERKSSSSSNSLNDNW
ncbi:protein bicaudal C-like [Macrosteles quadrilineatus]|uniref:protein bicaudal C-like n=1 Tax=Macrosteles quadrilineatus TaxID=74068 RepID=UPI0023E25E88|nr:protein bicaudal C-like [Macrosteles quadrilineatus]